MPYMLDTDISSYIIRARDRDLLTTMQEKVRTGAALRISAVTYAELRLGAERSRHAGRHNDAIRRFCDRLNDILPWDRIAADEFAVLQAGLLRAGTPIGANDAMIAAHARSRRCTLVTNNLKHFSRVPALDVEDWVGGHASMVS